jgi:sporulation protein YlmC with PRC-barrel domain
MYSTTSKTFHKEEIEGKTVIDSFGNVRGKVKDIIFSLNGSVTLIIERQDGAEGKVPMNKVLGISDYVIMKDEAVEGSAFAPTTLVTQSSSVPSVVSNTGGVACKFCGANIPSGTTYCPRCGRSSM